MNALCAAFKDRVGEGHIAVAIETVARALVEGEIPADDARYVAARARSFAQAMVLEDALVINHSKNPFFYISKTT